MPRKEKSFGERKVGKHTAEEVRDGLNFIRNGMSIRKAAHTCGVPFSTLKRYHHSTKDKPLENQRLEANYSVNKIFNPDQEKSLKEYFEYCHLLFYGLTAKECRKIAFQCAKINELKMPDSWIRNEMAGKDWLMSFRKRHGLALLRPEPCSLARATSFNKNNVDKFYDNLQSLIDRDHKFADGTRIFNLDETSTTTVHKPPKVIAVKGKKVAKVTSGERGTLVTTCCIIGAGGIALPPVMIFPRKNFKDHMIKNTPPGTLGLATPTGWMNSTIFPEVIKHVIKHTNASKENPCILIMDNHESHLCIEALDLAKNAGIHILTLHPHTSSKLQPLDVGVYSPFKTYYNAAIDSWLLRHPGKPASIYDLGEIIGTAFQKSMTPTNITKAFAKCGIYPFDRNLFSNDDFLPSSVTDRPCPECLPREEGFSQHPTVHPTNPSACSSASNTLKEPQETSIQMHQDALPETESMNPTACSSSQEDLQAPDALTKPQEISIQMRQKSLPTSDSISLKAYSKVQISFPSLMSQHSISLLSNPNVSSPEKLVKLATDVVSALITRVKSDESDKPIAFEQSEERNSGLITTPPIESQPAPSTLPSSSTPKKSQSAQKVFISPFGFLDPIKAGPRKSNRKRRRPGRSLIATDTPEKQELEREKAGQKKIQKAAKKKKTARKVMQSDDEEVDEEEVILSNSDDSPWEESDQLVDETEEKELLTLTDKLLKKPLKRRPKEGEYILVEFATKKQKFWYVGKVLEERNEDLEYYISYLRRKNERFFLPDKPDLSLTKENDIKFILPKPAVVGTSSRPFYKFDVNFACLNVR